jgi:AcrR family transcriptional regulator
VVFTTPPPLPRGRHELSRDQVTATQRERMLIAATELLAGVGYRGFGVREICSRAAVSRVNFYDCFADKDGCIFDAYDRFIAVFLERLAGADATGDGWAGYVRGFTTTYLETLQRDLVSARAFQVEMDALGAEARKRRRAAIVQLAELIRDLRERRFPGSVGPPLTAYIGAVYALRQITSDALDERDKPALLSYAAELTDWLTRMTETPSARERKR